MTRFILFSCLCFGVIAPSSAIAQMTGGNPHLPGAVGCDDSPTPGKRPPNMDCAILAHKNFDALPPGPLVWRFENFPTTDAAQRASTPASAVAEAGGKVWLLTLAARGVRSKGATFVAETELLPPIPSGPSYEIVVSEADLRPDAKVMTHKHSGPETWFLLTGEQCVELPDRAVRGRAGQTATSAPAETPMKLNITGPAKRDALFLIVHDSSKPWNTFVDWQPKGFCQK
jgi:quercetin dioxygenase-like cupin family protein